jgi:hypothetical protein
MARSGWRLGKGLKNRPQPCQSQAIAGVPPPKMGEGEAPKAAMGKEGYARAVLTSTPAKAGAQLGDVGN